MRLLPPLRALVLSTLMLPALVLPAALLGGCTTATTPEEPLVVLRAYDVPQALASETQSVLSSLLYRGKDVPKLGSVVLSPTGQVLVSAPASFHRGVEQVVKKLQKDGPTATPPRIEMEYVLVLAKKGTATVPEGLGSAIDGVLMDVAKREGFEMKIFDRLTLSSVSGDRAELRDKRISVRQTATAYGDSVLARVDLNGKNTSVEAKVQLVPGRPLVLARAGYEPRPGDAFYVDGPPQQLALFYVLVANILETDVNANIEAK